MKDWFLHEYVFYLVETILTCITPVPWFIFLCKVNERSFYVQIVSDEFPMKPMKDLTSFMVFGVGHCLILFSLVCPFLFVLEIIHCNTLVIHCVLISGFGEDISRSSM